MIAAIRLGLGLTALGAGACSVDDAGLSPSSPKLDHDGATGGITTTDGSRPDVASNGGAGGVGLTGSSGTGGSPSGGAGAGGASTGGAGGTTGMAGVNGAAGTTGSAGVNGTAGAGESAGTTGTTGTAGTGGTAGVSGTAGTTGTTGTAGAGGTAGSPGGAGGRGGIGGQAGGGAGGRGGRGGTGGSCTANNCSDGCCANNQCVHTTSAQLCGTMGASCMACAPCQLCSGKGQCAIDPASRWTIVADSAQLAKNPSGGGNWDPLSGDEGGSAPDPFCEFENPAGAISDLSAGVTSTITDTLTPTWDEVITPAGLTVSASVLMANNPAWRIWVGDEDCGKPNDPSTCGTSGKTACSYQQPISASSLQSGMLTISNYQSCVSLTLTFSCQSPAVMAAP